MQEKNILQSTLLYLGIVIITALFAFIYFQENITTIILGLTGEDQIQESKKTTSEITSLLLSLDSIPFDTSVLSLPYLQTLTPFVSFPIDAETLSNFGKSNPFIGTFTVVTNPASPSVGGVVYSTQRSLNSGNAVRAVAPAR